MGHDQLFKDFLREFLREFLELFYPDVAGQLNFATVRFLDKEFFADFPEGDLREADLVVHVESLAGRPELVLIHLEVQANRESNFEARMFQYYALLWLRHRLPIFPIAVYIAGARAGLTQEEYGVTLFGRDILSYRYECVGFEKLSAGEYAAKGNAVAAALAALMDRSGADEPLTLRALMLQRVAKSELDGARKLLLLNLIETYFALEAKEAEGFRKLLLRSEFREVREMQVTWADRMKEEGREQGREQGREEGLLEGKREALLRLVSTKFGPLPQEVTTRVQALTSLVEVDAAFGRALDARSLADTGLGA